MEVHHHSHTARKKWTHYFCEFLMLFLAVFCGFLAEYQLEQIIEHHREKDYVLSMLEDLKTDTTKINEHVSFRNNRRRYMDSLLILLKQPDYMSNTSLIYYYARLVPRNRFFYNTDRTLLQLKNAGVCVSLRSGPLQAQSLHMTAK